MESWSQKRKIEKNIETSPLVYVARAIALVVAAIFIAAFIPFVALYSLKVKLQEKYAMTFKPKSVLTAIRNMKSEEEMGKYRTMRAVMDDLNLDRSDPKKAAERLTGELTRDLKSDEKMKEINQNKIIRYILRDLSRSGSLNPEWLVILNSPEMKNNFLLSSPQRS